MKGRVNIPIMLASLLFSVMMWFFVYAQSIPSPDTVTTTLAAQGLDEAHFFAKNLDSVYRIKVQGPTDKIQLIKDERPTAYVDLSTAKPGIGFYPVQIVPAWVRQFVLENPLNAKVTIENMKEKTVEVSVEGTGAMSDPSFTLEDRRVAPTQVTVKGPESEIDKVTKVRAYLDLKYVNPSNPQPQSATLQPLDDSDGQPQHVRVIPSQVVITPVIIAAPSEKTVLVVPQFVGQPAAGFLPDGWSADPQSVVIVGKSLALASISKVQTERINVEGLRETSTFPVQLRLPVGTQLKGRSRVNVRYLVRTDPNYAAPKKPTAPDPLNPGGR